MQKIKEMMSKEFVLVGPEASIQEISRLLVRHKMSGLPVVDKGGHLLGFVSERDIIAAVASADFLRLKAKDIMTKKVAFVEDSSPLEAVTRIFAEQPFRYLPVTRKKKLVGIISRKDVIGKLLGQYY